MCARVFVGMWDKKESLHEGKEYNDVYGVFLLLPAFELVLCSCVKCECVSLLLMSVCLRE